MTLFEGRKSRDRMTPKQERFVAEYLVDLNATQAAIRAGYSKKTAEKIGSENIRKPEITAAIEKRQKKIGEKLEVTQERVIAELAKIGFSDIRKAIAWHGGMVLTGTGADTEESLEPQPHGGGLKRSAAKSVSLVELIASGDIDDNTAAAISEISQTRDGGIKIKFHDKKAALTDLAKYLGLFTERVDVKVTMTHEEALKELE